MVSEQSDSQQLLSSTRLLFLNVVVIFLRAQCTNAIITTSPTDRAPAPRRRHCHLLVIAFTRSHHHVVQQAISSPRQQASCEVTRSPTWVAAQQVPSHHRVGSWRSHLPRGKQTSSRLHITARVADDLISHAGSRPASLTSRCLNPGHLGESQAPHFVHAVSSFCAKSELHACCLFCACRPLVLCATKA